MSACTVRAARTPRALLRRAGRSCRGRASTVSKALAALRVFDGLDGPEIGGARAWAKAHLPPTGPSVLLHGDLLGQNILLAPDAPPTVIDWEHARRGDPAYDIAIVTRGVKHPFQVQQGRERLLEEYHGNGGAPVTLGQVALHELCLVAGWYRDSLAGVGPQPPHEELARMMSILRRAQRCAD